MYLDTFPFVESLDHLGPLRSIILHEPLDPVTPLILSSQVIRVLLKCEIPRLWRCGQSQSDGPTFPVGHVPR